MKRIISSIVALLLLCSISLTGCGIMDIIQVNKNNKEASGDAISLEASANANNKDELEELCSTIPTDLEEIIDRCLLSTNKKNSLGYNLDENYFLWLYGRYGEGTIRKIAEQLEEGKGASLYRKITGCTLHTLWILYSADLGINLQYLKNVYVKEGKESTDMTLAFVGDINFDEEWGNIKALDKSGDEVTERFSEDVIRTMDSVDIMMANNEFTYGVEGTPLYGKAYTFMAKPEREQYLRQLSIDIVGLANNHVCDYGDEGLISTLNTLRDDNMPYVGAGENIDEASKIVYYIVNGKKIAITAATQIERTLHYTKEATKDSPGVIKCLDPNKYEAVIKEAKENADYVVAYVHWGTEGRNDYGMDQMFLAHRFVEAGADVIIGNHTHCLQGLEVYNDVPIYYSLGNFWFDWDAANASMSAIAEVTIHEDGTSAEYITIAVSEQKDNNFIVLRKHGEDT